MRILYWTLGVTVAFSVFWLVALSTDYWAHLALPKGGVFLSSRQQGIRTTVLVTKLYVGLWRHCRVELTNSTVDTAPSASVNKNDSAAYAVNHNASHTADAGAENSELNVRQTRRKQFHRDCSLKVGVVKRLSCVGVGEGGGENHIIGQHDIYTHLHLELIRVDYPKIIQL